MSRPSIAVVVPPTVIAAGGTKVLLQLARTLDHSFDVDLITIKKPGIKWYIKYLFYNFGSKKKLKIKSDFSEYDKIIVSWVEDVHCLIHQGLSEKIIHYVQSIEYWSGNVAACASVYSTNLNRIVIAGWMKPYCSGSCQHIYYPFVFPQISTQWNKKQYITTFSHPGFWKNTTENLIVARQIADLCDMKLKVIGRNPEVSTVTDHESVLDTLAKSKVFVSLSYYEGLPLIVMEAISRGCRVILSDIPAHREILNLFGCDTVLLIPSSPIRADLPIDLDLDLPPPAIPESIISKFSHAAFNESVVSYVRCKLYE